MTETERHAQANREQVALLRVALTERRAEVEKWARYVVQMRDHLLANHPKATLTGIYNEGGRLRQTPDSTHPVAPLVAAHDRLD